LQDIPPVRLRLSDPSSARRLAAFLRSVGVETTAPAPEVLVPDGAVDTSELAIYLRVWSVLHPELPAQLEDD
jgi:hypothetical protein